MKKIFLTLSVVALFSLSTQAQEPTKSKTTKKETVNPDGTKTVTEEKTTEEPKKSGTRMAINEKGTPGTKSTTNKKETAKEEKTETQSSPTGPKPH